MPKTTQPPPKKAKRSHSQQKSASNNNSNDSVLIIIEDGAESMDVTLTGQVFAQLGMTVVHAGRQASRPMALTKNVSLRAQINFKAAQRQARRDDWKIMVLPGGNHAVARLMNDVSFLSLLETHVETQNGLVASMGAFCVHGLSSLKYIDPLGPTCFPVEEADATEPQTTVVMKEGNIWTAPGLGTATELALAMGEHLYGPREARRVAKSVGYVQGDWHVDNLRDLQSHHRQQDTSPSKATMPSANESQLSSMKSKRKRFINSGFWETVWPVLSTRGWGCDFEDKRRGWIFWRPGCDNNRKGRKGSDWFDSSLSLLQYLSNDDASCYADLMTQFDEQVAKERDKAGEQFELAKWSLFRHVVWRRLAAMGWRRVKSSTSPNKLYCTPVGHIPQTELESPKDVLAYLLADEALCMEAEILYIIDLYRQCEQTSIMQRSSAAGKKRRSNVTMSPAAIEAETKRRIPALSML